MDITHYNPLSSATAAKSKHLISEEKIIHAVEDIVRFVFSLKAIIL